MPKFHVYVTLESEVSLVIEAPSKDALEQFFSEDDDVVVGTITDQIGAVEDFNVAKVGEFEPVKTGGDYDQTPTFCLDKDGEVVEE